PIETSVGSGSGFTALTPTDFNLDDNPDFAAVNPDDGTWTAFFGAGDGSFVGTEQEIRAFTLGPREFAIDTADFNGDTLPDVVVVGTSGDEASVYLNQGDGTFDLSQVLVIPPLPAQLAAADITGDGNGDIVVSMTLGVTGNVGEDDEVAVVIGKGDGTFVTRTDLSLDPIPPTDASGDSAESAEYADVDNDGFGDIVTTNGSQVGIFFGTADGSLETQPMKISIEGQEPQRSVVADVNDDGRPDIVTANRSSGDVSVLPGSGGRTFGPEIRSSAGSGSGALAAGDLNGDGRIDLVTANETANDLAVLLGSGDGSFLVAQRPIVGEMPTAVALGDLNGDGRLDVAVTNSFPGEGVSILRGNGDGTFESESRLAVIENAAGIVMNDFDGDGLLDIATTSDAVFSGAADAASVHINNGGGNFNLEQRFPVNNEPRDIVAADVDADGIPDLIVQQSFDVSLLVGNGDGTFRAEQQFVGGGTVSVGTVRVGDVDADGSPDLILATDDLNMPEFVGDVSILLNQLQLQDPFGNAPNVVIASPSSGASAVEGTFLNFSASATDDIAV
ncbi:VCBS repeat-containing protein, partial [Candidatus Uhrbacteria bacterium]|nr:VCBS repeat-containing protein [Candidatus Uhrbacteria bacterium]